MPIGQSRHELGEVPPSKPENFPAGQAVHSAAPTNAAYFPATHSWQMVFPLAEENFPAPQISQKLVPFLTAANPGAQGVQNAGESAPSKDENDPGGHGTHEDGEVAPTVVK